MSRPRLVVLALVLITLFGAWLRIEATIKTVVPYPIRADALDYFSYAFNLRHYGVYSIERTFRDGIAVQPPHPDAMRSPGYPLMLAPFCGDLPSDRSIIHIALFQALLGTLTIPLIFFIGRKVLPGAWPLLPALLVAISPQLVVIGIYVLSETLFTFLLTGAVACLAARFAEDRNTFLSVAGGALLGMAALTRPTLQYYLLMFFLMVLPMVGKTTARRDAILVSVGFASIVLPWIVRNWIVLGVVSDPSLMVGNIVYGHYPSMMFEGRPETVGYPYKFDPEVQEMSSSMGAALTGIWKRVAADPFTYAKWYFLGKPAAFFSSGGDIQSAGDIFIYGAVATPYENSIPFWATGAAMTLTHWLWILLAAFAVIRSFFARSPAASPNAIVVRLLASVFIYFVVVHIVGFPDPRYAIPLLPIVFVLASVPFAKAAHSISAAMRPLTRPLWR